MLGNHYQYLKHVIKDVLKFNETSQVDLNYCIYLLDKDQLPLNESYTVIYIYIIYLLKKTYK
jgi:hypothetical protein